MVMNETFPFFLDLDSWALFQVSKYLPNVVKGKKTECEPVNSKNYQDGKNHYFNYVYTFKRIQFLLYNIHQNQTF
jgi:hypothetical protein